MARMAIIVTVLCVLCHGSAAPAPAQDKPDITSVEIVAPVPSDAEDRVCKALDEKTELDVHDQPLNKVIDALRIRHKIPMQFDVKALDGAGIAANTLLTCELQHVTLRTALRLMLDPKQLAYHLRAGELVITTREKAANTLVLKVYPVGDLLTPGRNQPNAPDFQPLIDAIKYVAPDAWDEVGGVGNAMQLSKSRSLVIAQTDEAHEQIAAFLDALRRAQADERSEKPARQPIEALARVEVEARSKIRKALEEIAGFDFNRRPLTDVLADVEQRFKIDVRIDAAVLAEAGIASDPLVSAKLEKVPLRSALGMLLGANKLAYVVRDEVLTVTTAEKASDLVVVKIYPVGDLVTLHRGQRAFPNVMKLVEAITSTVGGWEEIGGPGSIGPFGPSLLIIAQTDDAHDQIAAFLTDARQARDAEPEAPPPRP